MPTLTSSSASLELQAIGWDEQLHPGNITFDTLPYAVSVILSSISAEQTERGWRNRQTAGVVLRKDIYPTLPDIKIRPTCEGFVWFIVSIDSDDLAWHLQLARYID